MKKQPKKLPALTLNRETLQRLDEPVLRALVGADGNSTQICCPSAPPNC